MSDKCHNITLNITDGEEIINHNFCDEMNAMLVCSYIELILPLFSIAGSFFFRKEAGHVFGANLPALFSVITGSLFLALNYKGQWIVNLVDFLTLIRLTVQSGNS